MIELIIVLYISLSIILFIPLFIIMLATSGLEFVNPKYLYNRLRVNWFGAIMLSIIFFALTAPITIWYWFYKLFTAGRRQDNE